MRVNAVTVFIGLWAALAVTGCAAARTPDVTRIALLAPFEGRYRELGYNVLYAARLAAAEAGNGSIDVLAVDDGGSVARAADRARALALDPAVSAAIVLGYAASSTEAQQAFGELPVLVVGHWETPPVTDNIRIVAGRDLSDLITVPSQVGVTEAAALEPPIVGGEVLALEQFTRLRLSLDDIRLVSSGSLPGPDFTERYQSGNLFAPEPGLLATLTYDATRLLIEVVEAAAQRQISCCIRDAIDAALRDPAFQYQGMNGRIRFENGYWADAPVNAYRFGEVGELIAVNDLVE